MRLSCFVSIRMIDIYCTRTLTIFKFLIAMMKNSKNHFRKMTWIHSGGALDLELLIALWKPTSRCFGILHLPQMWWGGPQGQCLSVERQGGAGTTLWFRGAEAEERRISQTSASWPCTTTDGRLFSWQLWRVRRFVIRQCKCCSGLLRSLLHGA